MHSILQETYIWKYILQKQQRANKRNEAKRNVENKGRIFYSLQKKRKKSIKCMINVVSKAEETQNFFFLMSSNLMSHNTVVWPLII